MLQLPISNLEGLLSSISSSIQNELEAALYYRLTGSLPLVVSDIKVITLTPDWIKESPLAICIVGCDLNKQGGYGKCDRGYYACLIDLLRLRSVRVVVRVTPSVYGETPFYFTSYVVGGFGTVINLKPYHGYSVDMCCSSGFEVGEFVASIVQIQRDGLTITPYEDWLLKFLSKRQAFLMLLETTKSYLVGIDYMQESKLILQNLMASFEEDIKGLIENYPRD